MTSTIRELELLNSRAQFHEAVAQARQTAEACLAEGHGEGAAHAAFQAAWAETWLGNLDAASEQLAVLRAWADAEAGSVWEARCRWIEGRSLRDRGDNKGAAASFTRAHALLEAAGQLLDAARCRRELAHTYTRTDPRNALPLLQQLELFFQAQNCPVDAALCRYFLAQGYYYLNRYQDTLEHLEWAHQFFAAQHLDYYAAWCDLDRGLAHWQLNHYERALALLRQARAYSEQARVESEVSSCNINIACVLSDLNRYPEAIELLQEAAQSALAQGRRRKAALCFMNLAWAYDKQGHYARALSYYQRARDEFAEGQLLERVVHCDLNLGLNYFNLGQNQDALAALERAITVAAEQNMASRLAEAEMYRAQVLFASGQTQAGGDTAERARALFVKTGQEVYVALCDRLVAQAGTRPTDKSQALQRLADSRAVFVKHDLPFDTALCDLARGELHVEWEEWAEARPYLQRARHVLYPAFPDQVWRADYALGQVALAEQQSAAALAYHLNAVQTIAALRAGLGLEQLSNDAFGAREHVLNGALHLAYRAHADVQALSVIEAAKAQIFVSRLAQREWRVRRNTPEDGEAVELVRRERELRYHLNTLRRRVSLYPVESQGDTLMRAESLEADAHPAFAELAETARAYEDVVQRLRLVRRGLSGAPSLAPFELDSFQEMADARWGRGWTALDYYLADDELSIAQIDSNGVRVSARRLEHEDKKVLARCTSTFQEVRRLVYGSLQGHSLSPASARYLHRLAALLIPPDVRAGTDERTLIIAPHGDLHRLPFHALMDGGRYLVERFAFVYTPSLQALAQLHAGDAVRARASRMLLCGLDEFGGRARALPHAERELCALRETLRGEHLTLWKAEATRRRLLAENQRGQLRDYDLLHFATHAVIEPQSPHQSRILLEDDDLNVLDVMGLDLDARLVTLSVCSGALARGGRGDELLGLVQAFFYAGARGLVASLWAVEDESTAQLMTAFYAGLEAGHSTSGALRAAQLQLHRAGLPPLYWAPFVAVGNVG